MNKLFRYALTGLLFITLAARADDHQLDLFNPAPLAPSPVLIDDLPDDFPQVERLPVFMWSIAKDGQTNHLIGSLHIAPASLYPLPPSMIECFAKSSTTVFEVDPRTMDDAFRRKLDAAGRLTGKQNLREIISPELRTELEATLRRLNAPLNATDEMKPWLAALLVSFSEALRGNGTLSINNGVDRYFIEVTQRLGKQLKGLETTDDQLKLFTSLSEELSMEFLAKTLHELEDISPLFTRMVAVWKNGDADGLWKIVEESFTGYPAVYQQWMVDRNKAWLDDIDALFDQNTAAFIVVGAAHAVGPDGLPDLLQERGYEVQQVYQ